MAAEGDAEVPASSPLLLEMASLRLPDSEEYEFDARRRADNSLSTSSSTDSSPNNLLHGSPRSQSFRQYNRRILYGGDSGGLVDFMGNTILDIMSKTGGLGGGNTGNASDMGNLLENPMATNNTEALVNGTWASNVTSVGNFTDNLLPELFYRHSVTMTAVYCVAYLLVFAVGLVGNCFVIAVVYRAPRMRTVTNFFIVNLAVADILVIVFCLPATLLSNIFVPWLLGWWMCKTVPYIQGVSVAASVYSLIAVSLDRFLAIWWPLKCQITKRRARIMILIIWVIALTTTIPWALYFDLVIIFNDAPDIQLCLEVWPNEFIGALYFLVVNLLFLYILPLIVISLCYILIWFKVWKRTIPSDTKDAQVERMQQKSKVKVVKMLVAVVILFVLSWLPLYVIFARLKLGGDVEIWEDDVLLVATPIAQWLGASNSCINPILYAFFNKKYRRGFVAILKSRRCCGRLRYYESINLMSSSVSMRKSSYYVNNNNSSTRRPPGQDTSVSYIYNNTGV